MDRADRVQVARHAERQQRIERLDDEDHVARSERALDQGRSGPSRACAAPSPGATWYSSRKIAKSRVPSFAASDCSSAVDSMARTASPAAGAPFALTKVTAAISLRAPSSRTSKSPAVRVSIARPARSSATASTRMAGGADVGRGPRMRPPQTPARGRARARQPVMRNATSSFRSAPDCADFEDVVAGRHRRELCLEHGLGPFHRDRQLGDRRCRTGSGSSRVTPAMRRTRNPHEQAIGALELANRRRRGVAVGAQLLDVAQRCAPGR